MSKIVLSCAALCLLVVSCKKKEDDVSRHDLLISGKWRISATMLYETTGTTTVTTDKYLTYPNCAKDDLSIFRSDNHLIADEGPTKCDTASPQQSDEGIWSLTEQDSKLLVVGAGYSGTFKINTLTGSTFEIELSDTSGGNVDRQVVTFSHVD